MQMGHFLMELAFDQYSREFCMREFLYVGVIVNNKNWTQVAYFGGATLPCFIPSKMSLSDPSLFYVLVRKEKNASNCKCKAIIIYKMLSNFRYACFNMRKICVTWDQGSRTKYRRRNALKIRSVVWLFVLVRRLAGGRRCKWPLCGDARKSFVKEVAFHESGKLGTLCKGWVLGWSGVLGAAVRTSNRHWQVSVAVLPARLWHRGSAEPDGSFFGRRIMDC